MIEYMPITKEQSTILHSDVSNTHWYISPRLYVIQEYDNDRKDQQGHVKFILEIETESNSSSQIGLFLFNSQTRSTKFTLP